MMKVKSGVVLLLSAMSCLVMSFPSMAATKIGSISLEINSNISAGDYGGDVDVDTDSSKYYVDDVQVTNEPKNGWEDNDKPKIKVTLIADDDYYFPSTLSKSDVDLSGDDGTVTSISRRNNDEMYVNITLDALDGDDDDDDSDYDLYISDLEWDDADGTASWEEADDARKYEVRLYRDGSSVTSVQTTSNTYYRFASYFTKSADYIFKVRAVYNSSNKGSWYESEGLEVSSSEARDIRENSSSSDYGSSTAGGPGNNSQSSGAWLHDDIGGWWYCNADRSYPVNQWQYINDYWYFFNEKGYMVTGWVLWNNIWYYCSDSGAMLTNTTTPDGYRVGADGAWIQ